MSVAESNDRVWQQDTIPDDDAIAVLNDNGERRRGGYWRRLPARESGRSPHYTCEVQR